MDKICLGTINERGENFAMFTIFITIYNYIYNQEYELKICNIDANYSQEKFCGELTEGRWWYCSWEDGAGQIKMKRIFKSIYWKKRKVWEILWQVTESRWWYRSWEDWAGKSAGEAGNPPTFFDQWQFQWAIAFHEALFGKSSILSSKSDAKSMFCWCWSEEKQNKKGTICHFTL